jgi:malate permease and related proteins
MTFEKEIAEYEALRQKYQKLFVDKMDREEYIKYNEILFSTHSCAIEGNSFSIDDTRDLKEKGLGMIPSGKSLLEAFEMLDHFDAYEYMIKNVGFIGYPIVSSIFGPKAIFYAALLNTPNTFFIFTAGVMLVKGEYSLKSLNPKLLFSPAMIAAFIAAILVACGVHTPDIIARPITIVGNITVPAALMIIGSSMARLPLREIVGSPKVYVTSFLRLIVVPLSVYYLFKVCGVSNIVNNINTVVIAMPVASFGTMFCMKYGRNPSLITEITFITTVGSILTIPLITMLF